MPKKRVNRFSIILLIFFSLLMGGVPDAGALDVAISKSQIRSLLSVTFPFQTRLGSSVLLLSDPIPHLYATSQEIGITLNILIQDQESSKKAKARTMVRGGLRFDKQQQQLQLIKPKLVRLDWVNKPAAGDQNLAEQIEQIVGKELPVIVLIDIKQLTGKSFTANLKDVKVTEQAIEIRF